MNKITKTIGCTALAALVGFSLAGCGGYKPSEKQGITSKYIYVGNTAATSGAYATVGVPFNHGLQAAFHEYNTAGGFGEKGLQVKLKHYDDEYKGEKGMTYTEKLVESDKVFALVGHYGENTVGATLDYVKKVGIPTVYAVTGISDLYQTNATGKNGCVYPVQPIYDTEGEMLLARALSTLGGKKIGVISTTDAAGEGMLAGIKIHERSLTTDQKTGVTITYTSGSTSDTDFNSQVSTLKAAEVDTVILATGGTALNTMMKSMHENNLDAKCITSYINASAAVLGNLATEGYINNSTRQLYTNAWVDTTNYDRNYVYPTANFADFAFFTGTTGWTNYTYVASLPEGALPITGTTYYMVPTAVAGVYDYYFALTVGDATVYYRYEYLTEAPNVTDIVPTLGAAGTLKTETYTRADGFYMYSYSGLTQDYWDFYNAVNAYCTAKGLNTLDYSANSYSIAGYIAGKSFLQGLERVEESGKPLTWSNYREALESAPIKVWMGGTVDYADGQRKGVDTFGLNSVLYMAESGEEGTANYQPAGYALVVNDAIRSIADVMAELDD